jgi:Protein of unknown function (DUF3987)/Type ISP C-terminal specificity domain
LAWGGAPADEFAKFPHFCFDEQAQAVFIEWSEDMHQVRIPNEDEPLVRQHLAKFDKLFPALALIFHLVDCAAKDIRGAVSKDAAQRAAAWCEYLEAHARRCYGLLKDDGLRAAQALAAKLERGALEDGFTLRDVRRNQWRSLTTWRALRDHFGLKGKRRDEVARAFVGKLFRVAFTILHAPSYQAEHKSALSADWAHLPIPKDKKLFARLVTAGENVTRACWTQTATQATQLRRLWALAASTLLPKPGTFSRRDHPRYRPINSGRSATNRVPSV